MDKGTNSIVLLAFRILPQIKFSIGNFILPIVGGVLLALVFHPTSIESKVALEKILGVFLSFDGAILGLILAVFGIYGSVESNARTLFSITKCPPESRFSFFKIKLVTVFKMCFWVFACSSILLALFAALTMPSKMGFFSRVVSYEFKACVFGFLAGWAQTKILVELKIYVFSMYQRAMNEARMLAIENKMDPADKGID